MSDISHCHDKYIAYMVLKCSSSDKNSYVKLKF